MVNTKSVIEHLLRTEAVQVVIFTRIGIEPTLSTRKLFQVFDGQPLKVYYKNTHFTPIKLSTPLTLCIT